MMKSLDIFQTDWEGIEALLKTIGLSLAILLAFYFLANVLQKFLRKRLLVRMDDPLLANFLSVVFRLIIILVGFLAGAGITAFVIGFALKDIGENFLAGILLAFKRPFKVGDTVDINGIRGVVLNLNLRDTQIKTPDGKDVFIPNATIIKNPLVNFTIDGFLRYDFIVGLDYGSDYQVARALILEAIQKVPGVLMDTKTPKVWVSELAESTLNLQVAFWVDTFDRKIADLEVKSQAIIQVLTTLEKAGYNLPARVLEIKNYRDQPIKSS